MSRYLARKTLLYLMTFFVAVTVDWAIPRLMPGDPINGLIARLQTDPTRPPRSCTATSPSRSGSTSRCGGSTSTSGAALAARRPRPEHRVRRLVRQRADPARAVPYTLALLVPAIVLSYIAGNRVGALAARRKVLDNTVLPVAYILTATPYMWLALVLAYVFAFRLADLPGVGRLRLLAAARVELRVRTQLREPLGAARSSRSSSSRSAAGRSGCGT